MQLIKANKEQIKTLFIAVLSVSAVVLALGMGLFEAPIQAGGREVQGAGARPWDRPGHIQPAALPTAVMASLGSGEFRGYLLEPSVLYDLFSGHLGEALGSSGMSTPATRAQWEAVLADRGVFFRYDAELPGDTLARWLGTEGGGADGLMQKLFLSVRSDEIVYLYYMGRDGAAYRSTTAVRPEDLQELLATLASNGARFGFLEPAYTGPNPDTVLLADYSGLPTVRAHNAVSNVYAQQNAFLEALGVNPALARSLDEPGARTIVEGEVTIQIHENGLITYQCQSEHPRLVVEGAHPAFALETARRIAGVLSLLSGEAEIALTDWVYTDGQAVYQFGYFLGGLPIRTQHPAATVVIDGQAVTEVTLFARAFHRTGQTMSVMSEIQAAAAAGETPIRLTLVAADGAAGLLGDAVEMRPRWLLVNEVPHG